MHTNNTPNLERPMLRMGSIAFFAGLVIAVISTIIHPTGTGEELMNNPFIFATATRTRTTTRRTSDY
jgi:hypothetical protein